MRVRARTTTTPVARVFINPTGSSKASRRPLGLKVGYASSRAHDNNDTNTNINTNYNNSYNSNKIFARARQQHQSLGFSSSIETWLKVLHLSLVFS
jgi:hypothetical protein